MNRNTYKGYTNHGSHVSLSVSHGYHGNMKCIKITPIYGEVLVIFCSALSVKLWGAVGVKTLLQNGMCQNVGSILYIRIYIIYTPGYILYIQIFSYISGYIIYIQIFSYISGYIIYIQIFSYISGYIIYIWIFSSICISYTTALRCIWIIYARGPRARSARGRVRI